MPIMPELEIPGRYPESELARVLERYLWLEGITPVHAIGPRGGIRQFRDWLEVRGTVRPFLTTGPDGEVTEGEPSPWPDPEDQDTAYLRASQARKSLLGWAEIAITEAEEAGYRHVRHPEIDLGGDVIVHRREPRKPDLLRCKADVRMWLAKRAR